MALILGRVGRLRVVKIGRLAGQYAKPRSSPIELLPDGTEVLAFRGENINGVEPTLVRGT